MPLDTTSKMTVSDVVGVGLSFGLVLGSFLFTVYPTLNWNLWPTFVLAMILLDVVLNGLLGWFLDDNTMWPWLCLNVLIGTTLILLVGGYLNAERYQLIAQLMTQSATPVTGVL